MRDLYRLKNVEQFYEDKKVLDIKELTIQKGGIIGFFGPNGSGKSTLFHLLSFVSKQRSGEIIFNGIDNAKISLEARQSVVMLPQNPYLLKRTVFDNVAFGLKLRNQKDGVKKKVFDALAQVGLSSSFAQRRWSQLSGGEVQRVALAARLILKPEVLILDEPTASVDINSAQMIKRAIFFAKEKWGTTLLVSSHDHSWLNQACDRKIALFQGKIVESGNVNLLFAPWEKASDLSLVKLFSDGQRLTISNSEKKKRDAVAMINSNYITLTSISERKSIKNLLEGTVSSIQKQNSEEGLLAEVSIAEVSLSVNLTREKINEHGILPGQRVLIEIDTDKIYWL